MNVNEIRNVIGFIIFMLSVIGASMNYISGYIATTVIVISIAIITFFNAIKDSSDNDVRVTGLVVLSILTSLYLFFTSLENENKMYSMIEQCYTDARKSKKLIERCENYEYILGTTYMEDILQSVVNR